MKITCGIILLDKKKTNVLALHPTGAPPSAWSIPKGIIDHASGEDNLQAAIREFEEETGNSPHDVADVFVSLGIYPYKNRGKALAAYGAIQVRDFKNPIECKCTFERRGKHVLECDSYMWIPIDKAMEVLHETQGLALAEFMRKTFQI